MYDKISIVVDASASLLDNPNLHRPKIGELLGTYEMHKDFEHFYEFIGDEHKYTVERFIDKYLKDPAGIDVETDVHWTALPQEVKEMTAAFMRFVLCESCFIESHSIERTEDNEKVSEYRRLAVKLARAYPTKDKPIHKAFWAYLRTHETSTARVMYDMGNDHIIMPLLKLLSHFTKEIDVDTAKFNRDVTGLFLSVPPIEYPNLSNFLTLFINRDQKCLAKFSSMNGVVQATVAAFIENLLEDYDFSRYEEKNNLGDWYDTISDILTETAPRMSVTYLNKEEWPDDEEDPFELW